MVATPKTVGIRESRRIIGDYVLTEDDVKGQKEFPDMAAHLTFGLVVIAAEQILRLII